MAKPIRFNAEMVRAILNGRKAVARRLIIPQPVVLNSLVIPPYKTGDYLYVRETWARVGQDIDSIWFEASEKLYDGQVIYRADFIEEISECHWRPSIHMPKEAARIFLQITDVHAERLQDIITGDYRTPININKEGIILSCCFCSHHNGDCKDFISQHSPKTLTCKLLEDYTLLWDSTVKKSDLDKYGWKANPWVWVIEFERMEVG